MKFAGKSEIGKIRKENEDQYYIDPQAWALAVADGMGGHENGKVAADLAIRVFAENKDEMQKDDFNQDKLAEILDEVNERVHDYKQEKANGKMMGTTYSAVVIKQDIMYIAHVGDSRIYLYRNGQLKQLSQEHSYLAELLRSGEISKNDLPNQDKSKHVLTKAIGPEKMVEGQVDSYNLQDGDIILLCTDGLHNNVSDKEIADCLAKNQLIEEKVQFLINLALMRGGNDNITLLLCLYEQEGNR